jgi:hypothetical protein
MGISLFILEDKQKRKLIEIMILVFSIIVILPGKINLTSNTFGIMAALFLPLAIFYWIASHNKRTSNFNAFKLITIIISLSFSAMLSAKLMEFMILPPTLFEMVFWAYYLIFTMIVYFALVSSEEEKKIAKWYLKPFGKIILAVLFVVLIYILSIFF